MWATLTFGIYLYLIRLNISSDKFRVMTGFNNFQKIKISPIKYIYCLFVWFDSLRPLNNLSVMRDESSWVEPVLS